MMSEIEEEQEKKTPKKAVVPVTPLMERFKVRKKKFQLKHDPYTNKYKK